MTGRIAALRGAIGFLTRIPIPQRPADWEAFTRTPATFPVVGALVGGLASIPLLATGTIGAPVVAFWYLLAIYLLTGVNHLDGVADLGDAAVVHGDADRKRAVLKDTTAGVGAVFAVSVVVAGVALGGLGLAGTTALTAVGIAVAAEVGGKTGMAAIACFSEPSHEGLGSQLIDGAGSRAFALVAAVALPATVLTWPHPSAAVALTAGITGAVIPWWWANRHLGGCTGDVFGAANEIGRVFGVHAGVIVWTLW